MREHLLSFLNVAILAAMVVMLWRSPTRLLFSMAWIAAYRGVLAHLPRGWRAKVHSGARRVLIYAERFNREATFVRLRRKRFSARWGFLEGWWKAPMRMCITAVLTVWLAVQIYDTLQSAQQATDRLAQQTTEAIVQERLGTTSRNRDQLNWELCVEASTTAAVNGLLVAPFEGLPDGFKAIGRSVVMHFGEQARARAELQNSIRAKAARCEPLLPHENHSFAR
ncbi:hypothetical protein [Roseateles sp.]|uniref:hypothetical protein n=1 Tax=Roseateles sp. TaxID=1971397 RepID=UPI0031D48193